MGRQVVLVCLLFGFIVAVLSQTTTPAGTGTTDATAANVTVGPTGPHTTGAPRPTGPHTTWAPTTTFRCYHCDNEPDNNVCNGVQPGQNGTGTMAYCDEEEFPDPVCFTIFKFNDRGNGWSFMKGCMDYEECKELFFGQMDDPVMMSCLNAWYFYNPPPIAGNACQYCCWKFGHWDFDKCNEDGYLSHYQSINDGVNLWDHELDRWPGHEKPGYPLEGEGEESGVSGLRMTALSLLSATMLSLLGALAL